MSKVTIGKLVADYNSATFEERQRSKDFEVVPRKMVEKLREECVAWAADISKSLVDSDPETIYTRHDEGRKDALLWFIKTIDEELKDFEEEEGEEA